MRLSRERIVYLIYGALALVVVLPLLKPGQIFLLDWQVPQQISDWLDPFSFSPIRWFFYIFGGFLHIPLWLLEKIFFAGLVFLSGWGMHRLAPFSLSSKIFAGLFYAFNPFIYSRFMYGHMGVVVAYALMPFFVSSLIDFFRNKSFKPVLGSTSFLILIVGSTIHFAPFILFILLVFSLCFFIPHLFQKGAGFIVQNLKFWKYHLIWMVFLVAILIVASFIFHPQINDSLKQITWQDFAEFSPAVDDIHGNLPKSLFRIASLYGFSGDRIDMYFLARDIVPGWVIWQSLLFILVIAGIVAKLKVIKFIKLKAEQGDKWLAVAMLIIGFVSLILALGVGYPLTSWLTYGLFKYVPFYKGFRDTIKWQALLAISLAFFAAGGLEFLNSKIQEFKDSIIKRFRNSKIFEFFNSLIFKFLIFLPLILMPLMFWGFTGQIKSVNFPASWFEVKKIISQDKGDFKMLFFPWHLYLRLSFVDNKIVLNPARHFFGSEKTLAGESTKIGKIYMPSPKPESHYIEWEVIAKGWQREDVGKMLAPLKVKYVVLAIEDDFNRYLWWLLKQKDLKPIYHNNQIVVFLNQSY